MMKSQFLSTLWKRHREGTLGEIWEDWRWIFQYSKRYKGAIALYTVLGLAGTSLGLVSSIAGKYTVDIVVGRQTGRLGLLFAIFAASALIGLLSDCLISRLSARINVYVNNDIQADVFDKLMDAEWSRVKKHATGDIVSRLGTDVGTVSSNAIHWIPNIIISVYGFAATFAVILHYDPVMALIALAGAPFLLLVSRPLLARQRSLGKRLRETAGAVVSFESETIYSFDTVKAFGDTTYYSRRLRERQGDYRDASLDYNRLTIKMKILMSGLGMLVQLLAFGYCLHALWTDRITYGTMILFLQQRGNLSGAFNRLVSIIPSFLSSAVSAHRVRELAQLPRERHLPEGEGERLAGIRGFRLCMKDMDFSYDDGSRVLHEASLEARPGDLIALVGPSGEGKTTILRLLLGLLSPEQGRVYLREADGRETLMNADTRRLFSYVPQGNTLISGTIAENLRMIKTDATEEELIQALKAACAWDFVREQKDGLQTVLGEKGHGLSEGQAQRIAIARALLRDAPVLLLDEATSALDVETETRVLTQIMQLRPEKLIILTTHRESVLRVCSHIYRVRDCRLRQEDGERS